MLSNGFAQKAVVASAAVLLLSGCMESMPKLADASTNTDSLRPEAAQSSEPTKPRFVIPLFNADTVQQLRGQTTSVQRDARCEQSVVPGVTGNIAGLITLMAQTEVKNQVASLPSLFNRAAPSVPQTNAWASVKIAARYLTWLPLPIEEKIGKYKHEQYDDLLSRESRQGRRLYPDLDQKLSQLLSGVTDPHDYTFKVFIRKRSQDNAVASPGGFLYIDEGLFDSQSGKLTPDGLFALAHEVSHVLQRHETYNIQSRILDSVEGLQQATTLINGIQRGDDQVVANLMQLFAKTRNQFGRFYADQELHADNCALRLLSQSSLSDAEMSGAVARFEERVRHLPDHADDHKHDFITIVNRPIDRHPGGSLRMMNLRESNDFWMKRRPGRANSVK